MRVSNSEIARVLYEIGEYLDMEGVAFKPRAYEKVAETIESLQEEVIEIYKKGGLKAVENIPGVGVSIAEKIEELIKTGKCKFHEDLKKKTPVNLSELSAIEGLGPRKIKVLYQKLKIKNLSDLEKSAKAGKISKLEGFGEKSEQNILQGIEFVKKSGGRFVLGFVLPDILTVKERLARLKEVKAIEVAGSVRRRKETIGDADILITINEDRPAFASPLHKASDEQRKASAGKIMDFFVSMPEVARVFAHGETKSAVKLKNGMDMDLRVVPAESYGAALAYFTGSKDHNVALRQLAIKKGMTLSEYGLYKGTPEKRGRMVAGKTEEEIYKTLGLDYIEPEMREMNGEIELAKAHKLPKLIGYSDLKGDLQVQTNWSDGNKSIEEMAMAAMKRGLEYIVITDHTKRLAMTNGLDERRVVQQMKAIDELNRKLKVKSLEFKVLKGSECDILKDGTMDLPDEILKQLDVIGASVHSLFNLPEKEQTERIKKAIKNPHVDILFHPTGRLINKREPYAVDMDEIIKTAKETGTILEIDAFPDRLDIKDEYIRKCVCAGVKMSIDSDAHDDKHFPVLEYGIAQARRGWAEKKDIINAWPVEKMLSFLKR